MWVLIVLQLMAGSGTSKSSMPIVFSGVTMQEFSSQQACDRAVAAIESLTARRAEGGVSEGVRNGIVSMKCVPK